jgi:hypothetical protein
MLPRSIAALCAWAASATAADWAGDYDALLSGLARNYANFEYTLTQRRIDLPAIADRERNALAAATGASPRAAVTARASITAP